MTSLSRWVHRVLSGRMTPAAAGASLRTAIARTLVRLPVSKGVQRWLMRRTRVDAFAPKHLHAPIVSAEVLRPVPPNPAKPDVYFWAVIDWHFRIQRPQHLALALARRGHRVFYISNELIDADTPGFAPELLDASMRLYQVQLRVRGAPLIYATLPDAAQATDLRASLAALYAWACTSEAISVVQHPFWAQFAASPPRTRCVYDCLDHHAGFEDNAPALIAAEEELIGRAELVVATSSPLAKLMSPHARRVAVVRNGTEFAFFASPPRRVFRDPAGRQVIGYYGAIAPWFDIDLVAAVARAFPDARVQLVGADTTRAREQLAHLPNVVFAGEVPYADLPYWLHGFDVCLLPFRVTDLTWATNPVKVYEYLSAGKPVVSVDLPELAQFEGLARTAADVGGFVDAVREALSRPPDADARRAMQAFAARQTWDHRAGELLAAFGRT